MLPCSHTPLHPHTLTPHTLALSHPHTLAISHPHTLAFSHLSRPHPHTAGESISAMSKGAHALKGVNEELDLMEIGWATAL